MRFSSRGFDGMSESRKREDTQHSSNVHTETFQLAAARRPQPDTAVKSVSDIKMFVMRHARCAHGCVRVRSTREPRTQRRGSPAPRTRGAGLGAPRATPAAEPVDYDRAPGARGHGAAAFSPPPRSMLDGSPAASTTQRAPSNAVDQRCMWRDLPRLHVCPCATQSGWAAPQAPSIDGPRRARFDAAHAQLPRTLRYRRGHGRACRRPRRAPSEGRVAV